MEMAVLINAMQCLAVLGTLAAAVATFRAVSEMKAQREDALRVEFTLAPGAAVAVRSEENREYDAYEWLERPGGDPFSGIQCANVGPSAAKAVRVQWSADWRRVLTDLNQKLACDDEPSCGAEVRVRPDRSISVLVGGVEREHWLRAVDTQCFPSILPYTSVQEYSNIEVPFRIRRLCDLAYDAWIRDGLGDRELLQVTLRIEYEDLNSSSHTQSFQIAFRSYDLFEDTFLDAYGVLVGEPRVLETYGLM